MYSGPDYPSFHYAAHGIIYVLEKYELEPGLGFSRNLLKILSVPGRQGYASNAHAHA